MCKTDKNARNDIISSVSFNNVRQNVQRKPRNWIYKNELIDFGGQNETRYNRISFLVLLQLTFEKRTENKSEELICNNQSESKKSNYFLPAQRNSITAEERWKVVNQTYLGISHILTVLLVPIYFFSHLSCSNWIRLQ